jgi:hypothetical protein
MDCENGDGNIEEYLSRRGEVRGKIGRHVSGSKREVECERRSGESRKLPGVSGMPFRPEHRLSGNKCKDLFGVLSRSKQYEHSRESGSWELGLPIEAGFRELRKPKQECRKIKIGSESASGDWTVSFV